jgi:hypothetical protein
MKKPSDEARRRYAEYSKDYKNAIETIMEKEKKLKELIVKGGPGTGYQKIVLAEDNLDIVGNLILMNQLSQTFLGVKNETYLNEARKCVYKALIFLEEIVTGFIDAPFSDYEGGLESISTYNDEARYNLVRKLGFAIDSLEEGFGEGTKWKWSFVELEGRFAAVAKNLLNLKTFVSGMDPRSEGYSARMAHLSVCKELLQQAADRYREKYELSTMRLDDFKAGIHFLSAVRRLHVVLGEGDLADVVKKKIDIWRVKMENDLKKAEEQPRR